MRKTQSGKRTLPQKDESRMSGAGLNFAASEAYRLLQTNLLFSLPFSSLNEGEKCRIVGITSALSGEGEKHHGAESWLYAG